MTGWRVYPWLLVLVALAGCSGIQHPTLAPAATPRDVDLGWVERYAAGQFTFRVGQFAVGPDGWQANVAVTNNSTSPYRISPQSFGLVPLDTTSQAELKRLTEDLTRTPPALQPVSVTPAPPPLLAPGETYRGTIEGSEALRSGTVLRFLFGPFTRPEARDVTQGADVLWVTDHAVRI
ncbi:MAG TPA: hypothetical protein VFP24_09390 [Gaiellaceae bacterium]|nr:hypothetical protein [Gaiellaceae bacterium]